MVDEQLKREVDAFVDEVWEDVVADMDRLVRHDSVEDLEHAEPGKPWGPAANDALVEAERMAERLGLEVTDLDGYLGFADVPGASGPERYVATIAHTDIVPTGEGWNFPPLAVTRKDGMLIGRGVADDKGPFVLSLYAAHFFARRAAAGHGLPYTLRCIIGNNEETGMGDVPYYLERYPEPLFCFSPDAEFPLICGEKGLYGGEFASGTVAGVVRTVDGRFTQTVDSRFPTSTTAEKITARLTELAATHGCTYEAGRGEKPFYISPESPEIHALLDTYAEYTGREGKAFTIGGGTYARHFARACAFGPQDPADELPEWVGGEHGPDEGVSEEAMRRALKIYIVSIARLMELEL